MIHSIHDAKAAKLAAFEEERRKAAERCQNGDPIRDRPRQRNEGKWEFFLDCDQKDRVVLEVSGGSMMMCLTGINDREGVSTYLTGSFT